MTASAAQMLRDAADLVSGSRHETYGDAYEQHKKAAMIVNGVRAAKGLDMMSASDVVDVLIAVKRSRPIQSGVPHHDSDLDCCAYQALRAYCEERERDGKG